MKYIPKIVWATPPLYGFKISPYNIAFLFAGMQFMFLWGGFILSIGLPLELPNYRFIDDRFRIGCAFISFSFSLKG